MAEYKLAHVGINGANPEEALKAAKMFETLFGLTVKEGNSSVFAGTAVEVMKAPYKGTHGHIGIGTPDVAAAQAELEAKGFAFDPDTAKHKPDGTLNAIYLKDEICGFAVHLVKI
ncbi:MAG: VOC family protein [Oscillibacter sp.]|nr:VOC family protein [Oscillibacter sp.]